MSTYRTTRRTRPHPQRATARALVGAALATVALVAGFLTAAPAGAAVAPPNTPASSLGVGDFHACVAVSDGSTRCWGSNSDGQLTASVAGVAASVATSADGLDGAVEVAGGGRFSCARAANGTMRCWGRNSSGELGDGSTTSRNRPVFVRNTDGTPLTGVTRISTGQIHACALLGNGTVRCWGNNVGGQLGDGTTTNRNRPVFVRNTDGTPLTGVTQISASFLSTCARLSNGTVRCWGDNTFGQLGDGTTTNRLRPVFVRSSSTAVLTGVAEVSISSSTSCARMTNGQARCWGFNGGLFGDGSTRGSARPVFVRNPDGTPFGGVAQIAVGAFQTCARLANGQVRCWGTNGSGQVGDGSTEPTRLSPTTVRKPGGDALSGVTLISTGYATTCARLNNGQVRCWGFNDVGQVGDGTSGTLRNLAYLVVTNGPLAGAR